MSMGPTVKQPFRRPEHREFVMERPTHSQRRCACPGLLSDCPAVARLPLRSASVPVGAVGVSSFASRIVRVSAAIFVRRDVESKQRPVQPASSGAERRMAQHARIAFADTQRHAKRFRKDNTEWLRQQAGRLTQYLLIGLTFGDFPIQPADFPAMTGVPARVARCADRSSRQISRKTKHVQ